MKKSLIALTLSMLFVLAGSAAAEGDTSANKAIEDSIKLIIPGSKADSIKPTKVPGLYEVMVGAKLFYMSEDGNYLVQGTLYDIKAKQDLTESRLADARVSSLSKVSTDKTINFKPKTKKHLIYVFTDIDCGYCRKLHSEIDQYLNEGIEIRYLFFPRAGEGSDSWQKAVSVWCAKDRNTALTKAKKGETIETKQCENPVKEHYSLGEALGASGTPMIVTETGHVLPGYVAASQLSKMLAQGGGARGG